MWRPPRVSSMAMDHMSYNLHMCRCVCRCALQLQLLGLPGTCRRLELCSQRRWNHPLLISNLLNTSSCQWHPPSHKAASRCCCLLASCSNQTIGDMRLQASNTQLRQEHGQVYMQTNAGNPSAYRGRQGLRKRRGR